MPVSNYRDGFDLLDEAKFGLREYGVASTVNVAKGDALSASSGYAALATALDTTFLGIASHAANNTSGANNAIKVLVIPPYPMARFRVPVEANALITQGAVGTVVDLESEDGVDINDTSVTSNGFFISEVDVSTDAVAINTYGYAIGSFRAAS